MRMGPEIETKLAKGRKGGRKFFLALLLAAGAASFRPLDRLMASELNPADSEKPEPHATLKPAAVTSPDIPFAQSDSRAEQELFGLVNQSRTQAGLSPLRLDPGISRAARVHAEAMRAAHELSHQFPGESSLSERLSATTSTRLDQEGENVALDIDAADAQQHLMQSPPHRENLLNPDYNVIGLAVVRSGDRVYVVQDFGHALPNYSLAEVKDRVAEAVKQARHRVNQSELSRRDRLGNEGHSLDDAACSMAQADKLATVSVHQLAQRYTTLAFTSVTPDVLPENASRSLADHNLGGFAIGACYARTRSYPNGAYWIVLTLD